MDTSILLARVIGPYMLIAGLGLFTSRELYKRLLEQMADMQLVVLIIGAFTLILGLLFVQFHNLWVMDWRVLLTLVGWMMLIKGATAMLAPDLLLKFADMYKVNDKLLNTQAVLALLFGGFISYMGFLAQ